MEQMEIHQLSTPFPAHRERETKEFHFRIIRFMFEAGI